MLACRIDRSIMLKSKQNDPRHELLFTEFQMITENEHERTIRLFGHTIEQWWWKKTHRDRYLLFFSFVVLNESIDVHPYRLNKNRFSLSSSSSSPSQSQSQLLPWTEEFQLTPTLPRRELGSLAAWWMISWWNELSVGCRQALLEKWQRLSMTWIE